MVSALVCLRLLRSSLLVRCAPRRSSSVIDVLIFVSTAATARSIFFITIVYPVASSQSAGSPPPGLYGHPLTRRCHFFRRVCSVSPRVGVSSHSFVRVRRRWSISQGSRGTEGCAGAEGCRVRARTEGSRRKGGCGTCKGQSDSQAWPRAIGRIQCICVPF